VLFFSIVWNKIYIRLSIKSFIKMNSRRTFLKQLGYLGVASQVGLLYACNDQQTIVLPIDYAPLTMDQAKILAYTIEILFPNDENGPSAQQLNSLEYIIWNLNDQNRDADSNNYILKGIQWIEETADEEKQKSFLALSDRERVSVVDFVAKKSWGEDWFSAVLTLIFESLLYDPIYHINKEQAGWNWLNHHAGIPRPNENNKYRAVIAHTK
jgi:gluconate 2-dehydrogenase gamma chain